MFTGNTLPLNGFSGKYGLEIWRDCNFAFVGKIPTRLKGRVVPCSTEDHISQAQNAAGVVGIVTTPELANSIPKHLGVAVAEKPMASLLLLQSHISEIPDFQWRSFKSRIHPLARIYPGAYVADKDVEIGQGTTIYPNAVVMPRSIIGERCTIGPGSVVCADAFEVDESVSPMAIVKQSGGVRIANDVDVLANSTLVRATFGGFTEIGQGTKIDNLVHIAHDCVIGDRALIVAGSVICGRVDIGSDVYTGPNSTVSNGISVDTGARVTLGSVVTRNVAERTTVTGNFAVEHKKWIAFMRSL